MKLMKSDFRIDNNKRLPISEEEIGANRIRILKIVMFRLTLPKSGQIFRVLLPMRN